MELEYAEKGTAVTEGKTEEKKGVPKSPHEAWCSYGLGDLTTGYENQLANWNGTIIGPQNTPLGDRIYTLKIKCGARYPDEAPIIYFINKINMPGVNPTTGKVESVLKTPWTRKNTLMDYLIAIRTSMEAVGRSKQPGPTENFPPPPI